MKKFLTLLFMVGFSLSTFTLMAQNPVFTLVPRDSCASIGDTIRVDCIVDDFTNVLSFQWSQSFNDASLTFIDVVDAFSSESITHGVTQPITMSWSSPTAVTAPAGTVFYTLLFELDDPAGLNSTVGFSNTPTFIEVVGEDSNGFLAEFTPNCTFNNGQAGIPCGGGGGGAINCSQFTNAGHVIEDDSVDTGSSICLPVYACGLNDLTTMQYTIAWDPSVLQFDSTAAYNMAQLDAGSFGLPQIANGFITFAWFDSTGVGINVPDETPIYELCFTGIGGGGESTTVDFTSDLTTIELNNPMGGNIPFGSDPGTVTISGNSSSALTVSVGGGTVLEGDTICVAVTTQNFEDMEGLQHSLGWDPAMLEYVSTQDAIPGYFFNDAPTFVNTGRLVCQWDNSAAGAPVTLADGDTLFTICFIAIGSAGDCAEVALTNNPQTIEAIQNDGMSSQSIPLVTQVGTVKITAPGALTFIMGDYTGNPGDTVCVPIEVTGFNQTSIQLGMKWDTAVIEFVEVRNLNLPPTYNGGLNRPGVFRALWSDNLGNALSLADGSTIFDLCFRLKGEDGDMTTLRFEGDTPAQDPAGFGFDMEFGDENGSPENAVFLDGTLTIEQTMMLPLSVGDTTTTNVACNGESTGAIDLTISGGQPNYTFSWSNSETTEDISGLVAGTYTVTITDAMMNSIIETYTLTEPATSVSVSSMAQMISCNGDSDGAVAVTPTGGVAPYTYDWSDNALDGIEDPTGLAAGFYDLTLSDANGCTATATAIVTEPPLLDFDGPNTTSSNVDCNGDATGSIDLEVIGGTTPYSYDWDDNSLDGTGDPTNLSAGAYAVTVTDGNGCTIETSITITEPAAFNTAASSQVDVLCNGDATGSINLEVSGGTAPYSFDWSDDTYDGTEDPSGLSAGVYGVTITDGANCTETATFTINQPSAISIPSVNVTNEMTNDDGAIDITVTGGVPPYSFAWSNSETTEDISGLDAGSYTVTITDSNACTTEETYTVNPASSPDPNATAPVVTNVACNGGLSGAIDITIVGGLAPYTFNWSSGQMVEDISGVAAGTYTVTVTDDNGQMAVSNPITITEPTAISTTDAITNVDCAGNDNGTIDLTVSGGTAPYTFQWDNGAGTGEDPSGLSPNSYSVTITDANSCTMEAGPFNVTAPLPLSINFFKDDVSCPGDNDGSIDITVNNGTAPYSYAWSRNSSPFAATEDLNNIPGGVYQCNVTDANGCMFPGPVINVNAPAAFDGTETIADVSCPNADNGSIDYVLTGGTAPYTFIWNGGQFTTQNIAGLAPGNYSVQVTDANGCAFNDGPFEVQEGAVSFTENAVVNNTPCSDVDAGSINLSVTGGSGTYTYLWNNSATTEDISGLGAGNYLVTVTDGNGCSFVAGPYIVSAGTGVSAVGTVGNTMPNMCTGSISLNVTGGQAPYTYMWSSGETTRDITALCPGVYTVTITDVNGCQFTDQFSIGNVFSIPNSGVTVTDVSCNGGSDGAIDITVFGGAQPYSFLWSNGEQTEDLANLPAGVYSVTVTDNTGTMVSGSWQVNAPEALIFTSQVVTNESGSGCNGGINVEVEGGTLPYSYEWSNGATSQDLSSVCKGDYTLTVVDANGCILVSPMMTVLPPPISFTAPGVTNVSCNGGSNGSLTIGLFGGCGPYVFTINGDQPQNSLNGLATFGGLSAGAYTIAVVDDFGQTQSTTINIIEPDPIIIPSINVNNNTNPGCNPGNGSINIQVEGGVPPYSYQWSNGATSEDISNLCEDLSPYSVTIIDANGCDTIITGIELIFGISIPEFNKSDITCKGDANGSIDITVQGGNPAYTYEWSDGVTTQDRQDLGPGVYVVTVTDSDGSTVERQYFIEEPPEELSATATSVNATEGMNDGAINLDIEGGWGGYMIQWTGPNGFSSTMGSPQNLFPGEYTVTIEDSNGCIITRTVEVTECLIDFDLNLNEESCFGEEDGFIIIENASYTCSSFVEFTYVWSDGTTGPILTGLGPGTYTVVITNSTNGFSKTVEIVLGGPDPLEISFEYNDVANILLTDVTGGTEPYSYQWLTETADTTANLLNALPGALYIVNITDANGCTIDPVPSFETPFPPDFECVDIRTIITPNNDGLNDEFIIRCAFEFENRLSIFNRWGQLVHEAQNYQSDWLGTNQNGEDLPEGGYFWVLEYNDAEGNPQQLKGSLTILR